MERSTARTCFMSDPIEMKSTPAPRSTAAALLADLEAGAAPVAIVADTHLPDLPGLELLHELDRRGLKVPTILLTSEADVTSAVSLMRAGAIDYIEKPHVDRVLLGPLRHLLPGADPDRG